MRFLSTLALCAVALPVFGDAPVTSIRPELRSATEVSAPARIRPRARPVQVSEVDTAGLAQAIAATRLRPQIRPVSDQALAEARAATLAFAGPDVSIRPGLRPDRVVQQALAKRRERRKGAICGDVDIQGERVGVVPGSIPACGIKDAVRVRAVSGVALSQQALMNCKTAEALNKWVKKGVQPTFGKRNPVVSLKVAAHYACRTRNNLPGARISEHGKGNAIDISAFVLENGQVLTVSDDWSRRGPLGKVHRAACGPFSTVLGPNADRFHRDHFHFDTARHRGGPYCR
ncbi:MAG: extensin family protein [Arenibacterium sp.]